MQPWGHESGRTSRRPRLSSLSYVADLEKQSSFRASLSKEGMGLTCSVSAQTMRLPGSWMRPRSPGFPWSLNYLMQKTSPLINTISVTTYKYFIQPPPQVLYFARCIVWMHDYHTAYTMSSAISNISLQTGWLYSSVVGCLSSMLQASGLILRIGEKKQNRKLMNISYSHFSQPPNILYTFSGPGFLPSAEDLLMADIFPAEVRKALSLYFNLSNQGSKRPYELDTIILLLHAGQSCTQAGRVLRLCSRLDWTLPS